MRTVRLVALLGIVTAGCLAPAGQVVGPRKPSDIVTLIGGAPATGGCSAAERPINIRTLPDGNHPFTIPAGKVLVLTGVEWFSTSTGAGKSVILTVLLRLSLGTLAVYTSHVQSTPAGAGYAGQQSAIPNVVVKPGVPLCVTQFIDNQPGGGMLPGAVILHGYLTGDE